MEWQGRIYSLLASEIIVTLGMILSYDFFKNFQFNLIIKEIKKIALFGFPLVLTVILEWSISESGKIFILNYLSTTELGVYSFFLSISYGLNIAINSTSYSLEPYIYGILREGKRQREYLYFSKLA